MSFSSGRLNSWTTVGSQGRAWRGGRVDCLGKQLPWPRLDLGEGHCPTLPALGLKKPELHVASQAAGAGQPTAGGGGAEQPRQASF